MSNTSANDQIPAGPRTFAISLGFNVPVRKYQDGLEGQCAKLLLRIRKDVGHASRWHVFSGAVRGSDSCPQVRVKGPGGGRDNRIRLRANKDRRIEDGGMVRWMDTVDEWIIG